MSFFKSHQILQIQMKEINLEIWLRQQCMPSHLFLLMFITLLSWFHSISVFPVQCMNVPFKFEKINLLLKKIEKTVLIEFIISLISMSWTCQSILLKKSTCHPLLLSWLPQFLGYQSWKKKNDFHFSHRTFNVLKFYDLCKFNLNMNIEFAFM